MKKTTFISLAMMLICTFIQSKAQNEKSLWQKKSTEINPTLTP